MSSDDIIIKMENISKCFQTYAKPIDRLKQMAFGRFGKRYFRRFWALRDINFEVHRGECVGVIGKNGAGKSTLLQILVGTLAPTTGTVFTKGRIAALLELGSGFNPDFTGHDNIYMNASILGLSRQEIDARYDEILDFADIGDFIDQPVKTYSSGMMVRLAFAVQIMVTPDILIVDEALSVGDAAFQRKCYIRLEEMLSHGMTLFLVTHDTETVKRFCQKSIFLKNGAIDFIGPAPEGVVKYFQYLFPEDPSGGANLPEAPAEATEPPPPEPKKEEFVYEKTYFDPNSSWGNRLGRINWVRIHGLKPPNLLYTPQKVVLEVSIAWDLPRLQKEIIEKHWEYNIVVGYKLANRQNLTVCGTNTLLEDFRISPDLPCPQILSIELDLPKLQPDDYFFTFALQLSTGQQSPVYEDLEWDDGCIQLRNEDEHAVSWIGMIKLPTEYHLEKE
ncbi:MAG: ABC transporter ATP-binding protein [Lentisphaeria bacterium]|nr:ABC transporter ATP-binding protein [Lentisphaeria bacterium]